MAQISKSVNAFGYSVTLTRTVLSFSRAQTRQDGPYIFFLAHDDARSL
jgi:hypothetical protein